MASAIERVGGSNRRFRFTILCSELQSHSVVLCTEGRASQVQSDARITISFVYNLILKIAPKSGKTNL